MGRPNTFQYQAIAGPVDVPAPIPELSWAPTYPDHTRRKPGVSVAAMPFIALTLALPNLPIPELSWAPTFPERTRSAPRVIECPAHHPSPEPEGTIALSWQPEYPDFTRRKRRSTSLLTEFRLDPFPILTIPLVVEWEPHYPSILRRAPHVTRDGFAFEPKPELTIPLAWQPSFPERTRRAPRAIALRTETQRSLQPEQPLPLTWSPVYPSMLRRAPGSVALLTEFRLDPLPTAPVVPELSWSPTYPNILRLAARPITAPFAAFVRAIPEVVIPLSWGPRFPAIVPARMLRRLPIAVVASGSTGLSPLPIIPPVVTNVMTWLTGEDHWIFETGLP